MKGAELPINIIVLIVIALIVLIGILALYLGIWQPGTSAIGLEGAKNNACQVLINSGCDDLTTVSINNFDADRDGVMNEAGSYINTGILPDVDACSATANPNSGDNLYMLCKCWYGADEARCKQICMCTGSGGGGGGGGGGPSVSCSSIPCPGGPGDCPPGCAGCVSGWCV